MKLTNPTDDELNAAFITEVCGGRIVDKEPDMEAKEPVLTGRWLDGKLYVASWSRAAPNVKMWHDWDKANFTRSFDAVLPRLEKWRTVQIDYDRISELWSVGVGQFKESPTRDAVLARAAVIALLRAHGVEVEFTT